MWLRIGVAQCQLATHLGENYSSSMNLLNAIIAVQQE